jgi:hypothetical protein
MNVIFQYAAKFVVGRSDGAVLAPGEYWTAVNVHNPNGHEIRFRKKFAVGLPEQKPGPVTRWADGIIGPDKTIEIDRREIERAVTEGGFLKGFIVIESPFELDVVVVYTGAGVERLVSTLHTERVPVRRLEVGLPDLVPVPDETGSFCRRDQRGNLVVTVRNQGTAQAGPSVTAVDFGPHGTVQVPTPPLGAGASVNLIAAIPPPCFDPYCEFRITVDANNTVVEADEGNNVAVGVCQE